MAEYEYNSPYIIIDMGSSTIKCGFSGDSCPRLIIPNLYSIDNTIDDYCFQEKEKAIYYGNEAFLHCATSKIIYPQRLNKTVNKTSKYTYDSSKLEGMLNLIFSSLNNRQISNNVFIIDSLFTPVKLRNDLANLLFETFGIASVRMEPQEIMTLYSTSKQTGLIVESGELNTTVVPIVQGYIVNSGLVYSDIAGETLTNEYLKKFKTQFDYYNVKTQYETARKIKEKFSEVILDKSKPLDNKLETFELPDGNILNVGNERYNIPEIMFNPKIAGFDNKAVHQMINESINNSDLLNRKELYGSIILGGGNSLIKNYPERLKEEVCKEQKEKYYVKENDVAPKVEVEHGKENKYSAWIGASGICTLRIMHNKWITRNDIEENINPEGEQTSFLKANPLEQKYIYLKKSN